jgi:hypothetical protein
VTFSWSQSCQNFQLYPPDSSEAILPNDDIVIFDSLDWTSIDMNVSGILMENTFCTSMHPDAKTVMVRSGDMADFIWKMFGDSIDDFVIWSGLYHSDDGWVWEDGEEREIIWSPNQDTSSYDFFRFAQWDQLSRGHTVVQADDAYYMDVSVICELKRKLFLPDLSFRF